MSQAFLLFRQCSAARTAAVASRQASAHVPAHLAFRAGAGARCRPYSTEASEKVEEKSPESGKKDEGSSNKGSEKEGENAQTECEKKLKAKEEEVTDLKVRLFAQLSYVLLTDLHCCLIPHF